MDHLHNNRFREANRVINDLLKTDLRTIHSIGTYFYELLEIVKHTGKFQHIDTDQTYGIKEKLIILLKLCLLQ